MQPQSPLHTIEGLICALFCFGPCQRTVIHQPDVSLLRMGGDWPYITVK